MIEHKFDRQADALYITLNPQPYAYGRDLDDERRIDFASNHQPIGVELLSVSNGVNLYGLPCQHEIMDVLRQYDIRAYSVIQYAHAYAHSVTGTTNVAFRIGLTLQTAEELDEYEAGIKEEVTV